MQTYFVRVVCDIMPKIKKEKLFNDIEGDFFNPFRYRAYVNNELFAERTWIWTSTTYLEENFQILAAPGVYPIRFETVDPDCVTIQIRDYRVITMPGRIINYQGETAVEISNEST
jgi:hypothetical protein